MCVQSWNTWRKNWDVWIFDESAQSGPMHSGAETIVHSVWVFLGHCLRALVYWISREGSNHCPQGRTKTHVNNRNIREAFEWLALYVIVVSLGAGERFVLRGTGRGLQSDVVAYRGRCGVLNWVSKPIHSIESVIWSRLKEHREQIDRWFGEMWGFL
jgi:hypothetical protein